MKSSPFVWATSVVAITLITLTPSDRQTYAQDGVDADYRFNNRNPAYNSGTGPQVCIDEAHFEYHTVDGGFKPFAQLLRDDGYRVNGFSTDFTREALKDCQILVIANASAEVNAVNEKILNWSYPHPSAFAGEEITELILWVQGGGSLFLIVDHAPWPGAAANLAVLLGVHMLDGDAYSSGEALERTGMVVFGRALKEGWREKARLNKTPFDYYRPILSNLGTLAPHPILIGRGLKERVDSVVTYGGHAFYTSENWEPLLVFGPNAVCQIPVEYNLEDSERQSGPLFSVARWSQGAARKLGKGRIVVLGEAGMCTAQIEDNVPWGINAPEALHNAQFCLNVVHWLSGLLDGTQPMPRDR
ncbi:MAG: hypothetical protein IH899_12905 [Planctomycetes bacterium]|nr:hypothetical protein [Planctomycetota bacterium]